jgi:hypothetical protein
MLLAGAGYGMMKLARDSTALYQSVYMKLNQCPLCKAEENSRTLAYYAKRRKIAGYSV